MFCYFSGLFWRTKYLKHCQAGLGECVKMTSGLDCIGELATEDLHPQQGENENEQEQYYEQGINRGDGIHQGFHQITHRCPISENSI